MSISLKALLKRVPPETESVVERTRQRFNKHIRQILRNETRLQLTRMISGAEGEERETTAVRVFVTPGMPVALEDISFDDDLWLAIELAPLKSLLETTQQSMKELSGPIDRLSANEDFRGRYPDAVSVVRRMEELARALLMEAAKFNLLERIFAVNEDILGLYSYRLPARETAVDDEVSPPNIRADLYWAVIGFVSKVLGVSAEGLTVNVLAHELAHAYTHIGIDADGKCWSAHGFAKTESALKEGLAQYYTVRVVDRMEDQIRSAREAYGRLLPHQPARYRTHLPWLENHTPEEVRHAMLTTRRRGLGTVESFNRALEEAQVRLRGQNA